MKRKSKAGQLNPFDLLFLMVTLMLMLLITRV
jgi:hypothetical protein